MRNSSNIALLCAALLLGISYCLADDRAETPGPVKSEMHRVFAAFSDLQPYLYDRKQFTSVYNEAKIKALLSQLGSGFHRVDAAKGGKEHDPGFNLTLKITNDLISDARNRFGEGRKEYAQWRLRSAADHCVTCHARYKIPSDFATKTVDLKGLNVAERGEFLMATRQFDLARSTLLQAVDSDLPAYERFNALRKWLVIEVRVRAKPAQAVEELESIKKKGTFAGSEADEIDSWIQSLKKWANEDPRDARIMRQAKDLVAEGLAGGEPAGSEVRAVQLLRATALLHLYLEGDSERSRADRGHALYLLGLSYSKLPGYFIVDLPETFLELCIREHPGSEDAKKAFEIYRTSVTDSFTGSGGVQVPAEEQLKLKELEDLANGTKSVDLQAGRKTKSK